MAEIKPTKKNLQEVSTERDFPLGTKITSTYAILSSQRSGSTLLSRMLYETGMAGDPLEYLNSRLLQVERIRTENDKLDLQGFLNDMQRRRTSPNGVFGMKVHYPQMLMAFGRRARPEDMIDWLKRFKKLIWIRRHDRVGQAISLVLAMHTQRWSSEETNLNDPLDPRKIHPQQLVDALKGISSEDTSWEVFLKKSQLPYLELWFEELTSDYEGCSKKVLEHLGLSEQVKTIPPPPIESQRTEANAVLRKKLFDFIGQET